jgi:hypothetical protein
MACVYRHVRMDTNMPFYVGIGSSTSRAFCKDSRNKHWISIVKNTEYRVDIIIDDIDIELAKEKEKEFISIYGRSDLGIGTLCNHTDGGEGTLNRIVTAEERKKRSLSAIQALSSKDVRERMSKSAKNKTFTDSHKENISNAKSYKVVDSETGKIFVSLRKACEYFGESYRKHQGRQEQKLKNIRFIRI